MFKKVAIIAATCFFGGIGAGFILFEAVAEMAGAK